MFYPKKSAKSNFKEFKEVMNFSFGDCENGKENCFIRDGKLLSVGKFEEVDLGVEVKKIDGGYNDSLFFESGAGISCLETGELYTVAGLNKPFVSSVYYRSQFFVTDGIYVYEAWCDTAERQSVLAMASRLTASRDRVWTVYLSKVHFSSAGDANDWTVKGSNIDLPERCKAIAFLDEKVYVFGRNVYEVIPDSVNTEIKVGCVAQNIGDINADTFLTFGNKILFIASGRLCYFSKGKVTVKNALPFTGYVPVSCAAYNGKYVLVMRNKAENKGFLAVYDADKLTLEGIINRNFNSVCLVMSGFYACDGSKLYKLTDKHERFFHSEKVALEKNRSLLELSLITRFPLKITVKSGRAYSEFRLAGSNRKQSIRLHSGGEEASFGFYSDCETCVEEAVLKTVGSGRDV